MDMIEMARDLGRELQKDDRYIAFNADGFLMGNLQSHLHHNFTISQPAALSFLDNPLCINASEIV